MLSGKSSCGKTTTLNIVHTMILDANGVSKEKKQLGADKKDFSDVVLFNNSKIAFFTMGDYSSHLIDAIKDYNEENIDILICACNDKFVRPYSEIKKHPNQIILKTISSASISENSSNISDANTIYSSIN